MPVYEEKCYMVTCLFFSPGKANVNATDMNGNNALHLCLMERPALMEFAKVKRLIK